MKMRRTITKLNIANSNGVSENKHEEIKGIIQELLPYAELEENKKIDMITLFKVLDGETVYVKTENGIVGFDNLIASERWASSSQVILSDPYSNEQMWLSFESYGRNWSLTREELL